MGNFLKLAFGPFSYPEVSRGALRKANSESEGAHISSSTIFLGLTEHRKLRTEN